MSTYKISWLERKTTSTGKNKIDANLVNDAGETFQGVTIWSDFPDFDGLMPERSVEGDIMVKKNGQYTNTTLYPIKTTIGQNKGFGGGIKAAQERKEVMIEKAQARKNDSIAYFNSINSAISFVSAFMPSLSPQDAFSAVVNYREKFLAEWQKYEASDETDKRQPF